MAIEKLNTAQRAAQPSVLMSIDSQEAQLLDIVSCFLGAAQACLAVSAVLNIDPELCYTGAVRDRGLESLTLTVNGCHAVPLVYCCYGQSNACP
jgi:hypothetical protein